MARYLYRSLRDADASVVASGGPKIMARPERLPWLPKPVPGCGPRAMRYDAAGDEAPLLRSLVVAFAVVAGQPLPGSGNGSAVGTSFAGVVGCGHGNGSV